jgi:hypothetical protein
VKKKVGFVALAEGENGEEKKIILFPWEMEQFYKIFWNTIYNFVLIS